MGLEDVRTVKLVESRVNKTEEDKCPVLVDKICILCSALTIFILELYSATTNRRKIQLLLRGTSQCLTFCPSIVLGDCDQSQIQQLICSLQWDVPTRISEYFAERKEHYSRPKCKDLNQRLLRFNS